MTTDITELAQSLKAAAEKAKHAGEAPIMPFDARISALKEYQITVCPDNVLALVEALEKAQQVDEELCKLLPPGAEYMDPPDGGDVTPLEGVRRMVADYRQRIAELESRTVKLPKLKMLEDYLAEVAIEERKQVLVGVKLEFHRELAAAGIKVETE
ncbi:hypothetical protein [Klebsiella variicola]|uniref:hypothetical protein n=1 Tax=Klebsiella variicola TaxID=244366 RepID=UPI002FE13052